MESKTSLDHIAGFASVGNAAYLDGNVAQIGHGFGDGCGNLTLRQAILVERRIAAGSAAGDGNGVAIGGCQTRRVIGLDAGFGQDGDRHFIVEHSLGYRLEERDTVTEDIFLEIDPTNHRIHNGRQHNGSHLDTAHDVIAQVNHQVADAIHVLGQAHRRAELRLGRVAVHKASLPGNPGKCLDRILGAGNADEVRIVIDPTDDVVAGITDQNTAVNAVAQPKHTQRAAEEGFGTDDGVIKTAHAGITSGYQRGLQHIDPIRFNQPDGLTAGVGNEKAQAVITHG